MAGPEGVQGEGVRNRLFYFIGIFNKNERSSVNRSPPPKFIGIPSPGVVDPPLNKKAYVDSSGFTGKPVKGESFNDPRGV